MNKYQPIIGLEVHVELKTKSKMFCGCDANYFGKEPNTHTCPVCLGLPGALPVPNRLAIEWCLMIGLALNCEIPLFAKFDRKNYFYPDLAKGYQISQYDKPFCVNGFVILNSFQDLPRVNKEMLNQVQHDKRKRIRIRRVHMEEDTAKLTHATVNGEKVSLIDFNRSGVPLVEIVTEPDFSSAEEVVEYLKKLQQIVRYLGVSNADMEKGDMRLEPNISLRLCHPELDSGSTPQGIPDQAMPAGRQVRNDTKELPKYKVEVKNINSFRFVEKAINYEIKRQAELLDKGETPTQETRGWDEKSQATKSQRVKEEANDYRYFPEPDIPPIRWEKSHIDQLQKQMPELPDAKKERFKREYELSEYDAEIITRNPALANFFEKAVDAEQASMTITPKLIASTIINKKIDIATTTPTQLIEMIVSTSQITQISQNELNDVIAQVLAQNSKAVQDYKNGKENVIMFLVGQTIKTLGKKVDANLIKNTITDLISRKDAETSSA